MQKTLTTFWNAKSKRRRVPPLEKEKSTIPPDESTLNNVFEKNKMDLHNFCKKRMKLE